MEKFSDNIKKVILAGIGAVAVTAENQKIFWTKWWKKAS